MSGRIIFAASQLDILEAMYVQAPQVPALYFLHQIDEVDTVALPNIQYLRVPQEIEHDTAHGLRVAERGFNVVSGASSMTWQTRSTALTIVAISNDFARASVTREDRRPTHCTL